MLKKLLQLLGKAIDNTPDTYTSEYNGQWRNKGRGNHEDWQWIERGAKREYKVSVFNLEDDYIITVGRKARPSAIEVVTCRDMSEVEVAIDVLTAYYGTLGNTIISRTEE